ncbi:Pimeloyl-ACP methyl ester carboxylesterase [Burkholderia sp. CF099]|nr:Pimeloyl-ACP methyl ester carboxylesterase [Burkholderia sp. CF099]
MITTTTSLQHHTLRINGMKMHYVTAGEGEPLVLLHGWPQTWYEWNHVIPLLARKYRLIVPDLRGAGDTGRPVSGYDKRTMANDIIALLDHLGIPDFFLAGHDFGGAVSYALAAQHRARVRALAIVEMVLPGFGYEEAMKMTPDGGGLWHFTFHMADNVAEMLLEGREREYLSFFYREYSYNPDAVDTRALEEYVQRYSAPGAMRATMGYYRTIFTDAADNRAWAQEKLTMPVLAIAGEASLGDITRQSVSCVAERVTARIVPMSGHWLPEEQPEVLAREFEQFFV